MTLLPPRRLGSPYPALVPKTDADGNTLAGVRLQDIAAPVATYTGWNLRKDPPDEGCDASGMVIPFGRTKAERTASGDRRLSLEERYSDHASYVRAVSASARDLERRRRFSTRMRSDTSSQPSIATSAGGWTDEPALDDRRPRLRDDQKIAG